MGLLSDLREIAQELLDDAGIDDKVGRAAHLVADALDDILDRLADVIHKDDDIPTFNPDDVEPDPVVHEHDGHGSELNDDGSFGPVPEPGELPGDTDTPPTPDTVHSDPEVLP